MMQRQGAQGVANNRKAARDVFAVAAQDENASRAAVELSPPAVMLHLVQPLGADGRGLLQDRS
jgi:hypothetical protein